MDVRPGAFDFACRDCEQGRLVAAEVRVGAGKGDGLSQRRRGAEQSKAKTASREETETMESKRKCIDPACEMAGKWQPVKQFRKIGKSNARSSVCNACLKRRMVEGKQKAAAEREAGSKTAADRPDRTDRTDLANKPAPPAPIGREIYIDDLETQIQATAGTIADMLAGMASKIPFFPGGCGLGEVIVKGTPNSLIIDFTDHHDLLEKIKQIAADELRTPEMQVLYWIRQLDRLTA
jgi:hypothetical protein